MKDKLKHRFNREPKSEELANAEKDALLLCELLIEKVDELEERINKLEKK